VETITVKFPTAKLTPQRELGLRIKIYRLYRNLSARDVEKQIDLPWSSLSRIESGKRSIDIISLNKLATVLQIPLENFLPCDEYNHH
jgi:transcriptional regulator with XRE-family HTH domain